MFEFYLLIFLLLIVLTIVISSLKIGISPMPSSKAAQKKILEYAKNSKDETIIDLGSGFGSLAIFLAVNLPNKKIIAYELSLVPYLISKLLKSLLKIKNLQIYKKDFLKEDLKNATLVCYLYFEGMKKLEKKLFDENINTTIISNTFSLHNIKPRKIQYAQDFFKSPIYIYLT
ncbi:hypothetical protein CRU99_01420 [Malaciobacter mytili]|uniref:rRNA adenine N-6-methyltransferase family protein n=1 Tax=Malaciobacter mytili TaxID=603050 RepID=UPI00100B0996|nr:rRNA adenine N-6-methyltransferase family protein [Malaciobacter mytili]RXI48327.1 hypothetical protein CRU99_01420 [Malaciobacter mytili]